MRVLPITHINDIDLHLLGQLHDFNAGSDQRRPGLHGAEPAVPDGERHEPRARRHAVAGRVAGEVARGYGGDVRAVRG